MSLAFLRRAVVATLLAEIGVAVAAPALPGAPGAVRAGGISLLWWYAGAVAPVLATAGALLVIVASRSRRDA